MPDEPEAGAHGLRSAAQALRGPAPAPGGPAPGGYGPAPAPSGAGGPLLTPARARVLDHLREHPDPVAAEELARSFGQHPNTVRAHLDGLVRQGLALRERVPGPYRGRPPWRYRSNPDRPDSDPRLREHQGLVIALATHLAERSPEPRAEARSAGLSWGSALVAERSRSRAAGPRDAGSGQRSTPAAARREVVALLADLDFTPRADRANTQVVLTTCPLLDVARRNPEVVCSVHEGMVAGALTALGGVEGVRGLGGAGGLGGAAVPDDRAAAEAPDDGVRLAPFAHPRGCILTLPRAAP